jgi:hypothetical protein
MDIAERILRISAILRELKVQAYYSNPIHEGLGIEPATRLLQESDELVDDLSKQNADGK